MRLIDRDPTPRELEVLRFIYANPGRALNQIAEGLGSDRRATWRRVVHLKNMDLLEFVPRTIPPKLTHRGFETLKYPDAT